MRKLLPLVLALILPLAACGDDPAGPSDNITGTYTLQSINGATMPVTVQEQGVVVRFTSGRVTLNADQTFSTSVSFSVTQGTSTFTDTRNQAGTYVRNNNAIQFTYQDGTQDVGSISGNTLTVTSEGAVFVFQK